MKRGSTNVLPRNVATGGYFENLNRKVTKMTRVIAFLVAALIAVTAIPAYAGFHINLGYNDGGQRYNNHRRPQQQYRPHHRPQQQYRPQSGYGGGYGGNDPMAACMAFRGRAANAVDHYNRQERCRREVGSGMRFDRYDQGYGGYGYGGRSGYPGHPSFYADYRHVGSDRYYDGRGQEYGRGYVREYGSGYAIRPAIERSHNGQPPERDVANDPNCETIGDGKYRCRKSGAREERFSSERRYSSNSSADRPEDDVANDPNCEMVLSEEGHRKYRCHRGERVHRREVVEQRVAAPVVQQVQLQTTTSTVSKTVHRWYGYAYNYVARGRGEVLRILREDDRKESRVAAAEIQRQIGQRLGMSWDSKDEFLRWFETESVTEVTCTSENIREVDMSRTDAGGSVFDFSFHRSSCYKNETFFVANGEVFLSNVCLNVAVDRQKPVAQRP